VNYPSNVTEKEWAASPLAQAPADDDRLREVATTYVSHLYTALTDFPDRAGAAAWPDKFKTLDDKLAYLSGKVRLALESSDGPRELTSAVLSDFECVPSPWASRLLTDSHAAVSATGTIEVFGLLRRELPMVVADVGAAIRERFERQKKNAKGNDAPPGDAFPGSGELASAQPSRDEPASDEQPASEEVAS